MTPSSDVQRELDPRSCARWTRSISLRLNASATTWASSSPTTTGSSRPRRRRDSPSRPRGAGPRYRRSVAQAPQLTLDDVDLSDPDGFVGGIPHDWFALLRDRSPVHWTPERHGRGFWSLT